MLTPRRQRLALLALLVTMAGGGVAASLSLAHDAPMPAHRRHGLLPKEEWVMKHFPPFDERTFVMALKIPQPQFEAFLYNDHHTLAQLADQRRVAFEPLVETLAGWTADVPGVDAELIKQRIRLTLVSGHLAQHVFFHVFHGTQFSPGLREASGLSRDRFNLLRDKRWSYRRLIKAAHGNADAVQEQVAGKVRANAARGVATLQMPQSEADAMSHRQLRRLPCWFNRPAQHVDQAAPYDRAYTKHAPEHTSDDVPTTRAAQAKEDRAIAHGLAGRPHVCWDLPEQLKIDPGKPLTRDALNALAGLPMGYIGPVNDAHKAAMHHHE